MSSGVVSITSNTTAGVLTEIAALGAQDVLLSCDPKCSLFHQSYCRITNFAMGEQTLSFHDAPSGQNWRAKKNVKAEVLRSGDLLGEIYLQANVSGLPIPLEGAGITNSGSVGSSGISSAYFWKPLLAFMLVQETRVIIGQQEFEKIDSHYFAIHNQISRPEGKGGGKMVGDYTEGHETGDLTCCTLNNSVDAPPDPTFTVAGHSGLTAFGSNERFWQRAIEYSTRSQKLLLPLPFFWTKYSGDYLNVVGSQYHNIIIEADFEAMDQLVLHGALQRSDGSRIFGGALPVPAAFGIGATRPTVPVADAFTIGTNNNVLSGVSLVANFIHLDSAERRLKAQGAQTLRMVYVQPFSVGQLGVDQTSQWETELFFNHPVTRLLWVQNHRTTLGRFGELPGAKYPFAATNRTVVFQSKFFCAPDTSKFVPSFTEVEILVNNHTRSKQCSEFYIYAQPYMNAKRVPTQIVYSYAFALYPEAYELHSGSFNFSRIDNVVMRFKQKATIGVANSIFPLTSNTGLQDRDSIGLPAGAVSHGAGDAISGPFSPAGARTYIYAESINFYKQAAGMFGLLFAN